MGIIHYFMFWDFLETVPDLVTVHSSVTLHVPCVTCGRRQVPTGNEVCQQCFDSFYS